MRVGVCACNTIPSGFKLVKEHGVERMEYLQTNEGAIFLIFKSLLGRTVIHGTWAFETFEIFISDGKRCIYLK